MPKILGFDGERVNTCTFVCFVCVYVCAFIARSLAALWLQAFPHNLPSGGWLIFTILCAIGLVLHV